MADTPAPKDSSGKAVPYGEPAWAGKLAYVSASMASGAFNMIFTAMLMIYYSPPGGQAREELLPITVTGVVLGVGRIFDALSDPIVAYLSDRTKTRLGRRIPWVIGGMFPLILFFMGLWAVPDFLKAKTGHEQEVVQLTRAERKVCQDHLQGVRGDGELPAPDWLANAEGAEWYGQCQHMVTELKEEDDRDACMREMTQYKADAKKDGKQSEWATYVPQDSLCASYGKGCPLFPKAQAKASADAEGAAGGGSFFKDFATHWKVALWLAIMSTGFWLSYTAVFVPHLALMPVIARTDKSRMSINLLLALFNILGVLLLQQILRNVFTGPLSFPDFSIEYFATVVLVASVLIGLTPLFIREPVHEYRDEEHYSMWQSVKWSFTNKAFILYVFSTLFMMVGFMAVLQSIEYVVPLLLHRDASTEMTKVYGAIIFSISASFAVMIKLSEKFDKKVLFGASLFIMAFVMPLLYLLGEQSILGIPTIYFAYFVFLLIGMPVAGVMSLQNTIVADIIDEDEIKTGLRREAMFFGSEGLIRKGTIAIVPLMTSLLFASYGYCHPAYQSNMGVRLLGPVTALFVLVGAIIFIWYPIKETDLRERRSKYLAERASSEDKKK